MNVSSTTFALVLPPLLAMVYFTFLALIKEVTKLPTIKVNAWFAPNIILRCFPSYNFLGPFNHLSTIVRWIMVVQFIHDGPFPIWTTFLITLLEGNYQV
jgi:hypothetical protein